MAVKIIRCDCVHEYQDKLYGKGNRVCNVMKNADKARCSVCSKVKDIKLG